jgi:hypothetical protein
MPHAHAGRTRPERLCSVPRRAASRAHKRIGRPLAPRRGPAGARHIEGNRSSCRGGRRARLTAPGAGGGHGCCALRGRSALPERGAALRHLRQHAAGRQRLPSAPGPRPRRLGWAPAIGACAAAATGTQGAKRLHSSERGPDSASSRPDAAAGAAAPAASRHAARPDGRGGDPVSAPGPGGHRAGRPGLPPASCA